METFLVLGGGALIGVLAVVILRIIFEVECLPEPTVTLSLGNKTLVATPKKACVYFRGSVTFENQTEEEVTLIFADEGPFPPQGKNPRGTFKVAGKDKYTTGPADRRPNFLRRLLGMGKTWRYRGTGAKSGYSLDPEIMIKS